MMVLQACCHPSLISHLADQDLKSSHCLNPMCDNKIGFYSDLALCGGRDIRTFLRVNGSIFGVES